MVRLASLMAVYLAVLGSIGFANEYEEIPFENSPSLREDEFNTTTAVPPPPVSLGAWFGKKKKKNGVKKDEEGKKNEEDKQNQGGEKKEENMHNKLSHIPLRKVGPGRERLLVGTVTLGSTIKRDVYVPGASNAYEVIFNTQSGNTWMFDSTTNEGGNADEAKTRLWWDVAPKKKYDCKVSSSAKQCKHGNTPPQVVQEYPDGGTYWGGSVKDTLMIGSQELEDFHLGLVGSMNRVAGVYRDPAVFDGSVGLAPHGWNTNGMSSAWKEMNTGEFSFYLSKTMMTGEITVGGYNSARMSGSMAYVDAIKVPMVAKYYGGKPESQGKEEEYVWGTVVESLSIKKKVNKAPIQVIIETANRYGVTVPTEADMKLLAASIDGATLTKSFQMTIFCDKLSKLNNLELRVKDGVTLSFTPQEYFGLRASAKGPGGKPVTKCLSFFKLREKGDAFKGMWGFGQYFIRKYYTTFKSVSGENPMIGFAEASGDDEVPYNINSSSNNGQDGTGGSQRHGGSGMKKKMNSFLGRDG